MEYELKVTTPDGTQERVIWTGKDGESTCASFVCSHPGYTVHAWRQVNRVGFFPGMPRTMTD